MFPTEKDERGKEKERDLTTPLTQPYYSTVQIQSLMQTRLVLETNAFITNNELVHR